MMLIIILYVNVVIMIILLIGDISIFKSTKLQDILKKGPGYHEPVRLDFDAAYTAIMNNIDNMLDLWSKKEGICVQCFDGWKLRFKQIVLEDINKLKVKYNLNYNNLNYNVKYRIRLFSQIFCLMSD